MKKCTPQDLLLSMTIVSLLLPMTHAVPASYYGVFPGFFRGTELSWRQNDTIVETIIEGGDMCSRTDNKYDNQRSQ